MKVLQVINSLYPGGAEKLILETVPLMNERNVETDVLVFTNDDYPFHKLLEEQECCKLINLNLNSNYSFKAILKLRNIILNYDVVHVHLFPAQYYVLLANKLTFSKSPKFVFTEHNTTNKRKLNKYISWLDKLSYRGFETIVCISDEIKNITSDYLSSDKKLKVVENGINLDKIYNASPLKRSAVANNIQDSDKLIFQVSVFDRAKDQPTLIKSLKYLPDNFKIVFAGTGSKIDESKELASSLGLSDRVFFLGVRKDIPELLKTVDYVVLSSKHEGLSLASLEGLASGKPFICTEVPGLIDVVKGAGIMFPYKDERAFASEVLKLDNNKKHYQEVVNKCLERASLYDVKNMTSKLISIYEDLLD